MPQLLRAPTEDAYDIVAVFGRIRRLESGGSMNRLSACLITLNEEEDLPRALHSLRNIADDIVVVDCGSTDRTREIALEFEARFLHRDWTDYAGQKNFAACAAAHDWILSLDADEALSPELRESLEKWKRTIPHSDVYELNRRSCYLGSWIRHSGWYPDYQRRLYRRSSARFYGIVHESLRFNGAPGRLRGDLLHYTIRTPQEHEEKVERYSTLAAERMLAEGVRGWRAGYYLAAPWSWIRSYILRLGFLDGRCGARIAAMACRTVRLKYGKLGRLLVTQKGDEI